MLRVGIEGAHSPLRYICSALQWKPRIYVCYPYNARCYTLISATLSRVAIGTNAPRRKIHKGRQLNGPTSNSSSNATRRKPTPSNLPLSSATMPINDVENTRHQELFVDAHPLHRPRSAIPSNLESTSPTTAEHRELVQDSHTQTTIGYDNGLEKRDEFLRIIFGSQTIYQAWDAYTTLINMQKCGIGIPPEGPMVPDWHLHHLAGLLSRTYPRTREVFLRLLSVLTTLRTSGGEIYKWEWNALVHCAGKGWRKTSVEDYRTALGVFKDMIGSGQASPSSNCLEDESSSISSTSENYMRPDIVTFTTLIDIAARTPDESALRHATSLLDASGIPWNTKTHHAMMPYYIRTNQLHAVPRILAASIAEGLDIKAVNNCMWAFAFKGRLRVAVQVYDHLRRNIPPENLLDTSPDSEPYPTALDGYANVEEENPILATPGFIRNATMPPDIVTYTLLIQALCYRGDLRGGLTVFRDMIATAYCSSATANSDTPICYKPTSAIYRAIFLGFARHAAEKPGTLSESLLDEREGLDEVPLPEFAARLTASTLATSNVGPIPKKLIFDSPWNLANLDAIFDQFLELDWDQNAVIGEPPKGPSDRMIYWIMVAYGKTSNKDVRKMFTIWKRLHFRFQFGIFNGRLSQRLDRLRRELEKSQAHEQ